MNINWLEVFFWLCAAAIVWGYAGFFVFSWLLARIFGRPVKKEDIRPVVSLIIAAYNEEKSIREKMENCLALTYPKDRLEIIVVADGSSDGTAAIVREYESRGIRIMHRPERAGKTAAINRAVPESKGEVLFFSDANTVYRPDNVENMVRNFADSSVGGVCGRKILLEAGERAATQGETAYWAYEVTLKVSESLLGSIATADGEIFALRRELFGGIPSNVVHDDMYLTMKIVQGGKRVVFEPEATSAEFASRNLKDEFHLKVRYASAGFQILRLFPGLLFPLRSWFGFQFFSHKVLRWTAPLFLLGVFISSAFLAAPLYRAAFWAQAAFYALAALGWLLEGKTSIPLLYFPLYFTMGNTAALVGILRQLRKGQSTLWRKAER